MTPKDSRLPGSAAPVVLEALAVQASAHQFDRKLLVCRRLGEGRELLRWLSAAGVGWIGFEPTTPRQLATLMVAPRLSELGLRTADEFDELALLDDALDGVLSAGGSGRLQDLAEGAGFREAVAHAVVALRLAGIDAETLSRVPLRDLEKRDALVGILDAYERGLDGEGLVDGARIFRLANQALAAGTATVPAGRIHILPGHDRRGLAGRLLELLLERGASLLPGEGVAGLARPAVRLGAEAGATEPRTDLSRLHDVGGLNGAAAEEVELELFAAASITDEVREVLRRAVAAGLQWDEIEIVATEPVAYGAALDALAQRLRIPVTFAVGLPLERTRPGSALRGYLRWIQDDFPEDVIRGLVERGDLAQPAEAGVDGAGLARRLRRMRIGRGRERYASALEQAERAVDRPVDPDDDRSVEEVAQARAYEHAQVRALADLLLPILEATPAVPDRLGIQTVRVSPADLARAVAKEIGFNHHANSTSPRYLSGV